MTNRSRFDLIRLRGCDIARGERVVLRICDLSEGFSSSRFQDSSCSLRASGRLIGRFCSHATQAPAISSPHKVLWRVYLLDRAPTLLGNNNPGYQTEKPVVRRQVERTNWRKRKSGRGRRDKEDRRRIQATSNRITSYRVS